MKPDDRIFFENISGYGFIAMFLIILMMLNPFIIIIPVTGYYTAKAWRKL